MRIALAQMEVIAYRPDLNVAKMLDMIAAAKREKADLIAFPEMVVGGYLLGDKWLEDHLCRDLMAYNEQIREASNDIAVVFGNVYLDEDIYQRVGDGHFHPNKDGRTRKYNAIYVYQNGKPAKRRRPAPILPDGVQPKTLLPNYRFFDDERYFFSLQDTAKDFNVSLESLLSPFLIVTGDGETPVGVEVCEDLWCHDYRRNGEPIDATKILLQHGAELIVNISASPWTHGKNGARDRRVMFLKESSGDAFKPFLYVNCTGAQNNGKNIITFDGGSTVYNSRGLPVKHSREPYEDELMIVERNEIDGVTVPREERSLISQKYDALITGIRHVRNMAGAETQPRYIIGLSGGIDSAVTAALLTLAVGPDKVMAVNMPSQYNSDKTKNAAAHVAQKLNIPYITVPIETLTAATEQLLDGVDADGSGKKLSTLNKENIQAKIRGTSILSNLTGKYRALFTNNGNKLEIALGYATLYGDVGGAIAPLGDLTKEEVFKLARFLNKTIFKDEVIPETLIPDDLFRFADHQIQPSAELKDNQVDPMKFGYHCKLLEQMTDYKKKTAEDMMQWYIEGTLAENLGIDDELLLRWGLDDPEEFIRDLEWFTRQIQVNVFKRVQAPPIIITSKSAYGYDIRESILPYTTTLRQKDLKKRILSPSATTTRRVDPLGKTSPVREASTKLLPKKEVK